MRTPDSTPPSGPSGTPSAPPAELPAGHGAGGTAPPVPPPVRGRRAHAGPPADESGPPPGPSAWERAYLPGGPGAAGGGEPAGSGGVDAGGAQKAPASGHRGRLRRFGPRTVRARVICLLTVPVVSLIALWGYATVGTAQDVSRLRRIEQVETEVRQPLAAAVAALQDERRAAASHLAGPGGDRRRAYGAAAVRTDRAVDRLRLDGSHTVAEGADLPRDVTRRLDGFVTGTESLGRLRTRVEARTTDWSRTYEEYTAAVDRAFGVSGALTGIRGPEGASEARVLHEFDRAGEMLAREDALLAAGQVRGSLSAAHHRAFADAASARAALEEGSADDLGGGEAEVWRQARESEAYRTLGELEDAVAAADSGTAAVEAAPARDWEGPYADVAGAVRAVGREHAAEADRTDPFTDGMLTPSGAAAVLGLAAVAAALLISVRIGRGLIVELVGLRNSALELARRKLPHAMHRLRAGQEIDIAGEAPGGDPGDDEIAQVGEALTTVHRAALRAAVERAELASGISGVFVNLARRSQVLVHRQLALLDSMERRAEDPEELDDLFRLDHLTTRMRRHAESLIILSGAAPGRAWRMPVPLQSVVRAAVSEVEDYARVEVRALSDVAVVGAAVADLTHLLAELVENAAQFSPPHTKVRVYGEQVGKGYAIEVEDRGLGMGKEALAAANRRIRESEALDLFDSDRLGLFVVSRLAARHGIQVSLRESAYGGTTVVVLLPTAVLEAAVEGAVDPGAGVRGAAARPFPGGLVPGGPGGSGGPGVAGPAGGARVPGLPGVPVRNGADGGGSGTHGAENGLPERRAGRALPGPWRTGPGAGGPAVGPVGERPVLAPREDVVLLRARLGVDTAGGTAEGGDGAGVAVEDGGPFGGSGTYAGRAGQEAAAVQAPGDVTELPRRVRQASMAPQLRLERGSGDGGTHTGDAGDVAGDITDTGAGAAGARGEPGAAGRPAPRERTPEEARARMAAYRSGWLRGGGLPVGRTYGGGPGAGRPEPDETAHTSTEGESP
ncbi:nitrate- and nitrite sensing domain-containing protein [Streptomyces sp. CNQ-509]|uniref:sensor histidine kinase n=1 Tax=Streptomyces sp. CNQ-509 TaxID=444103 RepID=UPI000B0C7F47|nr:nitrate- and nitrite sensing domain-containing protein [Streptomyces sp. CNQ-509]